MWAGNERLRCGYTTGSCAAMAAGAATTLLLEGQVPQTARLVTPSGQAVDAEVLEPSCGVGADGVPWATCAIRKDGGDDVDATDGLLVFARVRPAPQGGGLASHEPDGAVRVLVLGGEGVGRITKPGLEQPVGEAAINSVPRKMIAQAVRDAARRAAETVTAGAATGGLLAHEPAASADAFGPAAFEVTVSVPGGREAARRTFNPNLGIEGGISILGTTGIVEPLSLDALLKSVELSIRQQAALGWKSLVLVPGAYGEDFCRADAVLSQLPRVSVSNFIGEAVDCAAREGIERLVLVGHLGKLVKVAGGVMQTHSRTADCRLEIICAHAAMQGVSAALARDLMACPTTDAALGLLDREGILGPVVASITEAIGSHLQRRAGEGVSVGAVVFTKARGELARSLGTDEVIEESLGEVRRHGGY